jgi:hypothetical protein
MIRAPSSSRRCSRFDRNRIPKGDRSHSIWCYFSFYSAFAAYRVLYLKDMHKGARPKAVDWLAAVMTVLSSLLLFLMGFLQPVLMGVGVIRMAGHAASIVSIVFGIIGMRMGMGSIHGFIKPSGEKMFWCLPICRDDRQLHCGNDRFFRSESVALVWRGLVGMAVADDRRCAGDCHLDDLLQQEVFA